MSKIKTRVTQVHYDKNAEWDALLALLDAGWGIYWSDGYSQGWFFILRSEDAGA